MSQIRVFRCPRCKEFIASDASTCRFCSNPVDARTTQLAVSLLEKENKKYRRKQYAKHMFIGGGLFTLGAIVTLLTYSAAAASPSGGGFIIAYGLIFSGAGDFLYGLVGWLGELKKG